ncbi:hypothetical protein ACFFRR_008410 [Megaselia abdita]
MEDSRSISEFPTEIREHIFKFLPVSDLKMLSLVCWDWYNEIAIVWKERITLNLHRLVVDEPEFIQSDLNVLENSKRYFESIKILIDSNYNKKHDIIVKAIQLIRNRESLAYKNNIKYVSFSGEYFNMIRTFEMTEIILSLGYELISVNFISLFRESSQRNSDFTWKECNLIELKDSLKNLKQLNFSRMGPMELSTLCTELTEFSTHVNYNGNEPGPILETVLRQNVYINRLKLFVDSKVNVESLLSMRYLKVLELDGGGEYAKRLQKAVANSELKELRSLSIQNCCFVKKDFQAMQRKLQNLEELNLDFELMYSSEGRDLLFECCWGLQNLQKLSLRRPCLLRMLQFDLQSNENLVELSFSQITFSEDHLKAIVKSTQHLKKLSCSSVYFEFIVDKLFEILGGLPSIQDLVFKCSNILRTSNKHRRITSNSIASLKTLEIHNDGNNALLQPRTFKALDGFNLENLKISSSTGIISKLTVDAIAKTFINLKSFTMLSPQMLYDASFVTILSMCNLQEFKYGFANYRGIYQRKISRKDLYLKATTNISDFVRLSKDLKYVQLCYRPSSIVTEIEGALNGKLRYEFFQRHLENTCFKMNLSLDTRIVDPKEGIVNFIIKGSDDKVLEISSGCWKAIYI